jgi:hypothetical protein
MKYRKVPKRLIEETKGIIRLHHFLRYDCGLKFADELSSRYLKKIFIVQSKIKLKFLKNHPYCVIIKNN